MNSHQETSNHQQSSYQHHTNHQHKTYRCYIRTADMKCKIQTISTDISVSQLKQVVRNLLNLTTVQNSQVIKLIVNQVQLSDDMNLVNHLFQNAIIHVLIPQNKNSQNNQQSLIRLRIKQPPINCPPYELQNIYLNTNINQLKSKIIQFYQTQQSYNQIGQLQQSQLFLVYGGRILLDQKSLVDYDIDQNGIVYVVNGRIYSRQVTKQQAQKRIQQVRRGENINTQSYQNQQLLQHGSQIKDEQQNIVFNIVQNIVHDEDSDVEGQTANDLTRSQKIIHRYDSISKKIIKNNQDDLVIMNQEPEQKFDQEDEFKQQISRHLQDLNQNVSKSQNNLDEYLSTERNQDINIQTVDQNADPVTLNGYIHHSTSQNIEGVASALQTHPDSTPTNDYNEEDDRLLE